MPSQYKRVASTYEDKAPTSFKISAGVGGAVAVDAWSCTGLNSIDGSGRGNPRIPKAERLKMEGFRNHRGPDGGDPRVLLALMSGVSSVASQQQKP